MARGRDPNFDGSYESSRYASGSLEDDIKRGVKSGVYVSETPSGGTFKETQRSDGTSRYDIWEKGAKGDYKHTYYDERTGEIDSHSGKR